MTDYETFSSKFYLVGQNIYHKDCYRRSKNKTLVSQKLDNGYKKMRFNNRSWRQHRVVWLLTYGCWPVGDIDHINGDRADNRIENLRDVCGPQNQQNRAIGKNNKTGHMGISVDNIRGGFFASIGPGGRSDGKSEKKRFKKLEDAIAWRKNKEVEFGYHKNHGREA